MNYAARVPLVSSVVIGAAHALFLVLVWGLIAIGSPVNQYLLDAFGGGGEETAYLFAIYTFDTVVNAVLSLPFAYLLYKLADRQVVRFFIVALLSSLALSYWSVVTDSVAIELLVGEWSFWMGVVVHVMSFSLAFAVLAGGLGRANAT